MIVIIMTSVTISEKLRKRLKRLAAEYDTTQGQIIEMALNMMEDKNTNTMEISKKDNEIDNILNKISQEVREKDPQEVREKLFPFKVHARDYFIGAIAEFNNTILITHNTNHFNWLQVKVLTPEDLIKSFLKENDHL